MSFGSHEVTIDLQYSRDDCFAAAKLALSKLKFGIKSESLISGTIQANVKAGLTSTTWGDILTVVINQGDNGISKMTVNSTTKAATLLAGRQQTKNVQAFIDALTVELEQFEKASPTVVATSNSVADEIKKFKALLDEGILTQEEFDAKKKQLLGL